MKGIIAAIVVLIISGSVMAEDQKPSDIILVKGSEPQVILRIKPDGKMIFNDTKENVVKALLLELQKSAAKIHALEDELAKLKAAANPTKVVKKKKVKFVHEK